MERDIVGELELEDDELGEKLQRLITFTESEKFEELPQLSRKLLLSQVTAMATYENILTTRIMLLNDKDKG